MSTNTMQYLTSPLSFVSRNMREEKQKHRGAVFWLTGLSGAGKSTIAHIVEEKLFNAGKSVVVLDGDNIRQGLCSDLSFSPEGRSENIRRIAELSALFAHQGMICFCAFVTPLQEYREQAKKIIRDDYFELFISCSLEECEKRDVKGYYQLAREGKIKGYTGVSAPYDIPLNSDLIVETDKFSQKDCVQHVLDFVLSKVEAK